MANQEKFRAAYFAWKAATDDHNAAVDEMFRTGVLPDNTAMAAKEKRLAELYAVWMAESAPFVGWRGR